MAGSHRPIFLVGFMGAGKTTTGRALARCLAWDFEDLDDLIVGHELRGIAQILRESGEPHFRAVETRLLMGLRGRTRLVVACGGGTYAHEPSRAVIDAMGTAVWLQVPVEVALERCRNAPPTRPLLGGLGEMEALHARRLPAYRSAPLRVDVAHLAPEEAAERIAALLL